MSYKLLSFNNPKIVKGEKISNYLTAIMHLSPINTKICPYQDIAGCKEACLNTAGRGGIIKKGETTNVIQEARKRKTNLYLEDKETFMSYLITDIQKFVRYCEKKDKLPCIRLNGTSDIQCENYRIFNYKNIFESFPDVQFYDYTKIPNRKVSDYSNYHLTWSYSSANAKYEDLFWDVIRKGMSVAVVFRKPIDMTTWRGYKVVDGDKDDLRFLDPKQSIVALYAKGRAKKDTSGFVVEV